ncbi:MAG TPA: response regulator transcription factor [Phycisphaerales bacterium]|nr:response regulator transcription factor [Phycisphaerales bacterium]
MRNGLSAAAAARGASATKTNPTKVLCVDDHAFVAEGLKSRLAIENDLEVVGRLPSAEHLVSEVQKVGAEIVLLDIDMPGPDPFGAMEDLHRQLPHVRTIMLTAYVRDHYIDAAVKAGAWGYLSKSDAPETIVTAIRKVARGEFAFGPEVLERCQLTRGPRGKRSATPTSRLESLTPREQEILRMIGKGMSRSQIAAAIFRSPKTVDAHRTSIMEKLDIHDRVELARFAIREGLVEA